MHIGNILRHIYIYIYIIYYVYGLVDYNVIDNVRPLFRRINNNMYIYIYELHLPVALTLKIITD